MYLLLAGGEPLGKAKLWSSEHKKHKNVDQPACILLPTESTLGLRSGTDP